MKKIICIVVILLIQSITGFAQDFMSTYNLSKNELSGDQLFQDDYQKRYKVKQHRNHRFLKVMAYTGLLAGGLVLADQASNQDYFINNTMIYGAGGILTILATGLVISSVNGINKELYVATSGTSVSVVLNL